MDLKVAPIEMGTVVHTSWSTLQRTLLARDWSAVADHILADTMDNRLRQFLMHWDGLRTACARAGARLLLFCHWEPSSEFHLLASASSLRRRRHVPTQGHLARCFAEHPTRGEEAHARTITARADRRG
jgi:GH24 family phage-related lysozyme (muramidase)